MADKPIRPTTKEVLATVVDLVKRADPVVEEWVKKYEKRHRSGSGPGTMTYWKLKNALERYREAVQLLLGELNAALDVLGDKRCEDDRYRDGFHAGYRLAFSAFRRETATQMCHWCAIILGTRKNLTEWGVVYPESYERHRLRRSADNLADSTEVPCEAAGLWRALNISHNARNGHQLEQWLKNLNEGEGKLEPEEKT